MNHSCFFLYSHSPGQGCCDGFTIHTAFLIACLFASTCAGFGLLLVLGIMSQNLGDGLGLGNIIIGSRGSITSS